MSQKTKVRIGGVPHGYNKYGMLQQINPQKFDYSKPYLAQQSTNLEMAYLRIGFLLGYVPYETLKEAKVLELGPGTGSFIEVIKKYAKSIDGFDVAPTSEYTTVTLDQVQSTEWDILCAFDVIEHFQDVDDLWKINFNIGYFSSPCPPSKGVFAEWRHFKPNEHLTYIGAKEFYPWAEQHGYRVLACAYPEDCIRKRWDENEVNINSFIIKRNA